MPAKLSKVIALSGVCLVGLFVAFPALGQPYEHYTDVPAGTIPAPPAASGPPAAPIGGLTFYGDRGTFLADYPGATSEDFSNTLVPPNGIEACIPPMNSSSNDACFAPGGIVDGLSIDVIVNGGTAQGVVLAPPAVGTTSVSVGANSFVDDMVVDLTVPVRAFGLDLVCPIGAATVGIEIFGDVSGSLGTTTSPCGGPPGTFWGVSSATENIVSVTFVGQSGNDGELASNVLFAVAVPTVSAPALALLFVVLSAISAFFIWRRRVA